MKLAFIIGSDGDTFLKDIIPWAKERYDVRVHSVDDKEAGDASIWADIIWCEWATNAATWVSRKSLSAKLIVRLHRWEAYTNWMTIINWQNVDRLLVVPNPYTKEQIKDLPVKMIDLPNAINLKRFKIGKGDGRKIAYVGALNPKKNIPFLLQCFRELLDFDKNYTLHCAGGFQDKVIENYCKHIVKVLEMEDKVFFEGHQDDINKWFEDKSFIVCSSLVEGHPVAVMEGMACGLRPLIHNFPGCGEFFPTEYIFNTVLDFVVGVKAGCNPKEYRRWVERSYPFESQSAIIEKVFKELMT